MPYLLAFLGSFFASSIKGMVARVLATVGFGMVSYVGVSVAVDNAKAMIHAQLGGISSDVLNLMGLAGLDVFLSLIVSAYFGSLVYRVSMMGAKRLGALQAAA
jgi:hypothetical protein